VLVSESVWLPIYDFLRNVYVYHQRDGDKTWRVYGRQSLSVRAA